jgi:hypothetical protein
MALSFGYGHQKLSGKIRADHAQLTLCERSPPQVGVRTRGGTAQPLLGGSGTAIHRVAQPAHRVEPAEVLLLHAFSAVAWIERTKSIYRCTATLIVGKTESRPANYCVRRCPAANGKQNLRNELHLQCWHEGNLDAVASRRSKHSIGQALLHASC